MEISDTENCLDEFKKVEDDKSTNNTTNKNKNKKTDEPEIENESGSDWLPVRPFRTTNFYAYATFVDDNANIYVHDASFAPVLHAMEQKMKEYFDKTQSEPVGTIWAVGQLCTVKYFVTKNWYRGKVTEVADEVIKVLMIDYGNEEDCKHEDLRFEVMYLNLPAFANCVKLFNVFPKVGSKWFTSDLDELHKQVVEHKVNVTLKGNLKRKVVPAILELGDINVNEYMLQHSPNLTSCREKKNVNPTSENDVIIEEETFMEYGSLPITVDQRSFKKTPLSLSLIGQKVKVIVISIVSYNRIVFELVNAENMTQYHKLFKTISKDIEVKASNQPILYNINVGDACVCQYSQDGLWYRGEVTSCENIDECGVAIWFVDFGNFELVPRTAVRAIRPEWLELPIMHYRAEIDNIKMGDESLTNVIIEHLAQFCNTVKECEFVSMNPLKVRLYENDDNLLYQSLIDNNLLIEND